MFNADSKGGAYLGGDQYQEASKALPGIKMAFGKAFNPKRQTAGLLSGKPQRRRQSMDSAPTFPADSSAPSEGASFLLAFLSVTLCLAENIERVLQKETCL